MRKHVFIARPPNVSPRWLEAFPDALITSAKPDLGTDGAFVGLSAELPDWRTRLAALAATAGCDVVLLSLQPDDGVTTLREDQDEGSERVDRVMPLTGRVGGYLDVGFFYAAGDGSGTRADIGNLRFPEYAGVVPDSWVLMGDPLSTTLNSRGEPADTGASRAITFDGVNSQGKSSFILNAFNLNLLAGLGKQVSIEGLIDFVPRSRNVGDSDTSRFALGDFIDVKLGYLRWQVPVKRLDFDLFAGKIDPPFGYEYRIQESPSRTTVTPSLACRYTCGRPLGLKARFRLLPKRALIVALSVTNGSSFTENFSFSNEIDTNNFKTVMGRLSYVIPVGAGLEIGSSGSVGAQDFQPRVLVIQKQYGFDVHLEVKRVDLVGEFVQGVVDIHHQKNR